MKDEITETKRTVVLSRRAFMRLSTAGHVVTPLVFGFLIYLHVWGHVCLSWELIVLVILMTLPFLLPLLATYLNSASKDGLGFRDPVSDVRPATDVPDLPTNTDEAPKQTLAAAVIDPVVKFSPSARRVLRTLWHFQKEQPDKTKRWGFSVHPSSSDYSIFRHGADELLEHALATRDARGLVYISKAGIEFCETNGDRLGSGEIWTNFRPAN